MERSIGEKSNCFLEDHHEPPSLVWVESPTLRLITEDRRLWPRVLMSSALGSLCMAVLLNCAVSCAANGGVPACHQWAACLLTAFVFGMFTYERAGVPRECRVSRYGINIMPQTALFSIFAH